jgi:hypothetical protein
MSDVVYARTDTTVVWSGGISPIATGDVWDSQAPLVVERPDLFAAEPTRIRGQVPRPPATAEPEPAPPAEVVDKPRSSKRGR